MKRRRKSPKQRLLSAIKRQSAAAAKLRLRGFIQAAKRYEDDVDRMVGNAERLGWGDDAFAAEMAGKEV